MYPGAIIVPPTRRVPGIKWKSNENRNFKTDIMMRIEQAIARAKEQGKKVLKKDIAAGLWPDSSQAAQQVNISRLCAGKTPRINVDWVNVICEMTGCTADFLFGLSNE